MATCLGRGADTAGSCRTCMRSRRAGVRVSTNAATKPAASTTTAVPAFLVSVLARAPSRVVEDMSPVTVTVRHWALLQRQQLQRQQVGGPTHSVRSVLAICHTIPPHTVQRHLNPVQTAASALTVLSRADYTHKRWKAAVFHCAWTVVARFLQFTHESHFPPATNSLHHGIALTVCSSVGCCAEAAFGPGAAQPA